MHHCFNLLLSFRLLHNPKFDISHQKTVLCSLPEKKVFFFLFHDNSVRTEINLSEGATSISHGKCVKISRSKCNNFWLITQYAESSVILTENSVISLNSRHFLLIAALN